ncbi:MAG TPA: SRPBCC domain-containing protein [Candidatus Limnocylindria bacterium]|jgi:uncharacterized protein YndB with AHSA1/START domain|nr:SRPBCC domain-containing protein [Candidatus Limnocylindria bacterium]
MDTPKLEARASTFVYAPRDRVYDVFATAKGLDAWFTKGAEVDARPGGRIVFRWKDWGVDRENVTSEGRVLEAKRPERFVFEWWDKDPAKATTVEVRFEERDGGTIGWGEALTLAKFYVEHGLVYRSAART